MNQSDCRPGKPLNNGKRWTEKLDSFKLRGPSAQPKPKLPYLSPHPASFLYIHYYRWSKHFVRQRFFSVKTQQAAGSITFEELKLVILTSQAKSFEDYMTWVATVHKNGNVWPSILNIIIIGSLKPPDLVGEEGSEGFGRYFWLIFSDFPIF